MTSHSDFESIYDSVLNMAVYLSYDGDSSDDEYVSWCVDESIDEIVAPYHECVESVVGHYGSDEAISMLHDDIESDVIDELERNGYEI